MRRLALALLLTASRLAEQQPTRLAMTKPPARNFPRRANQLHEEVRERCGNGV